MNELKQIHAQLLRTTPSHPSKNLLFLYSRLLHFASSTNIHYSLRLFSQIHNPNSFIWNTLIRACACSHSYKELAFQLYYDMFTEGSVNPDKHTYPFVLKACAYLFDEFAGEQAHAHVLKLGFASDVYVNNSLIHFYASCGHLDCAQKVFNGMPERSVVSWNAIIEGLAMHGNSMMALEHFDEMTKVEGLMPNAITFVGILSACNHGGMVELGRKYFDRMVRNYSIKPRLEHYGCLVDLLARAGLIEEALDVVSNMPMKPDVVIYRSLLDACCKKNISIELSEQVAEKILESEGDTSSSSVYVLLSQIYASAARWNEVGLIRKLMTDNGARKEPGCSSIEINGVNNEFFAGDTSHSQTKDIYQVMDVINEKLHIAGHRPDISQAPLVDDESDNLKKDALKLHSERLAIAFGLLNQKPGVPIRIFKNLRVCNDCHEVTKLISKIFNVEIIVRDRARFHHFKNGACSCADYW
ncbi:hypothetical protein RDABS01_003012 [Bienertia sinuspersici]